MIFHQMKDSVNNIIEKIHSHPFNRELANGTLAKEKFLFYLIQDALYLADFSRALALTASRLLNNLHTQQFIYFGLDAINIEREFLVGYISQQQSGRISLNEQSPACFMYTNYLLKTAGAASVEEAVSSLLPCFFIYNEVGKKMAERPFADNPYQDWIDLYSGASFQLSVDKAITITNELGNEASESMKKKMVAAFCRATQLEWMFWESAYTQEQWLIGGNSNVL